MAKTAIAPAERVEIPLPGQPGLTQFSLQSAWATGRQIVRASGVHGLYRGNCAMLLRVVPYSGTASHDSARVAASASGCAACSASSTDRGWTQCGRGRGHPPYEATPSPP